jgi:hypothetical protein
MWVLALCKLWVEADSGPVSMRLSKAGIKGMSTKQLYITESSKGRTKGAVKTVTWGP